MRSSAWYKSLKKAPWTPPPRAFGIVWGVLYFLMAVAVYRVWSHKECRPYCPAIAWFLVQLFLNLIWTSIFFRLKSPGWALVDIIAMTVAAGYTYRDFSAVDPSGALLLLPYIAWLLIAFTLNLYIVVMN